MSKKDPHDIFGRDATLRQYRALSVSWKQAAFWKVLRDGHGDVVDSCSKFEERCPARPQEARSFKVQLVCILHQYAERAVEDYYPSKACHERMNVASTTINLLKYIKKIT